jgi:hypothetical protein
MMLLHSAHLQQTSGISTGTYIKRLAEGIHAVSSDIAPTFQIFQALAAASMSC